MGDSGDSRGSGDSGDLGDRGELGDSGDLGSGILDNSGLVRQIRLVPCEAPRLVRQICQAEGLALSFDFCVCLTEMENNH